MILSDLAAAWKTYLESTVPTGWGCYQGGDDVTRDQPSVLVRVEDSEEHEVLRGHYKAMMAVVLESIPAETTLAAHEEACEAVHCLGTQLTTAQAAADAVARTVDVREVPGAITSEGSKRITEILIELEVQPFGQTVPHPAAAALSFGHKYLTFG